MTLAACSEGGGLNPMSFTDQHGNQVLERLRYQRENGRFCDVFISVRDRQFAAHRNIISACSPYFDSILKCSKVTKEQVTVNCPNPYAFELFLNYMYSGSIVIDRSCVGDLLKLANNFLVTKLKNYCAEYLDRYLDAANCLTIRHLATKYNIPSLIKASCEFFDANINRCLLESVDIVNWTLVQIDKLFADPKYFNVISPDVHLKLISRWVSEDLEHREINFKELLGATPVSECAEPTLEFLLDYAPLFQRSSSCRYQLLHAMFECDLLMSKYEGQLNNLKASGAADYEPPMQEDEEEEQDLEDYSDMDDGEGEDMDNCSYPSDGESTMEPPVDGHPTTDEVLESGPSYVAESVGTKLRLKISIGGMGMGGGNSSDGSESGHRMRRHRHRDGIKKMSKGLKRRGRPPKRITDEDVDIAAFDEDELDGVYADGTYLQGMITYTEDDALNPDEVEDGEEVSDPSGSHPCGYCRFASNSEEETSRHTARKHNRNTIFMCPLCDFECNWNHTFYQHFAEHLEGPPFNCSSCSFVSDDRIQDILAHMLTHSSDRFFKCAQCGFRGRTRNQVWAHEKLHSDEAALHCIECGRSFNQQFALDQHMESHDHHRPHVCEECGFASKSADHLLAHKKGHNGDVFYCHIEGCDYSSPKKSQLAAHLRTHMAVRAHLCKICNRGFIEKSHLVRHERIHLEDKPFKCDLCEYASSRRDKLKEHILKHHNGNTSSKAHRRRYKRARQIAALAAQAKAEMELTGQESTFRPIDPSEQVEQWAAHSQHYQQSFSPVPRACSVSAMPAGPSHIQLSPSSMSMMNINLAGPDTPILGGDKDILIGGGGMQDPSTSFIPPVHPSLATPLLPRSPHNHSVTFGCTTPTDLQNRPMSLPPYQPQPNQPGTSSSMVGQQQPQQQNPNTQQSWMW